MEFKNVITRVEAYSIAEELYIEPGDVLLSINDAKVEDVFDYMFAIKDEYLEVLILKKNGTNKITRVWKVKGIPNIWNWGIILEAIKNKTRKNAPLIIVSVFIFTTSLI